MIDGPDPATATDPAEESEYVLGTRVEEMDRLGFQHQVWAPQTSALWQRAGFAPGDTILDVGCGPGYASFDLASLAGAAGRVIAVDISKRFVDHLAARSANRPDSRVEAMVGDVENLQIPGERVDAAFARWVLCFTSRPDRVLAGVARALRPGGVFAVMDYFNYTALDMAPDAPEIRKVVLATAESVRRRGGDLDVGRRLPALLRSAGLAIEHLAPLVRIARPGSALWRWPETFFFGYLPTLIEMGLLSDSDAVDFRECWEERSRDPDSFLSTPPMIEVVARKPAR